MFGALIWAAVAWAQEGPELEVTPMLDIRPRAVFGYTDGLSRGFVDTEIVDRRTRLGLHMRRGSVEGFASVEEARGWIYDGDNLFCNDEYCVGRRLEANEAWARVHASLPGEIAMVVLFGRKLITVHDGRLMSANDHLTFNQPLEAGAVRFEAGSFHWELLNFRDLEHTADLSLLGTSIVNVGYEKVGPVAETTIDIVSVNDQTDVGLYRNTSGLFTKFGRGAWSATAELYGQANDSGVEGEAGVGALFGVALSRALGAERFVVATVGYDALSGVGPVNAESGVRPEAFDPIYGDVHSYYGHLNLFQRPEDTDFRGLQDLTFELHSTVGPRTELEADLHLFWAATDPEFLGGELDLTARLFLSPLAAVEWQLSSFTAGPGYASLAPNRRRYPSTAYLQLRVGTEPTTNVSIAPD